MVTLLVLAVGMSIYLRLGAGDTSNDLEAFVAGKTTREVVSHLEQGHTGDLMFAVALPNQIQISDGEETLSLYDDAFYISIAPFIHQTHECLMHVFTSCRAELQAVSMHVRLRDQAGNTVFEGIRETYQNGFMGFWLQKNQAYTIEIDYEGYQGVFDFTTHDEDPTCLTDFQLAANDVEVDREGV